jgi:hypothetical protein
MGLWSAANASNRSEQVRMTFNVKLFAPAKMPLEEPRRGRSQSLPLMPRKLPGAPSNEGLPVIDRPRPQGGCRCADRSEAKK